MMVRLEVYHPCGEELASAPSSVDSKIPSLRQTLNVVL